MKKAKVPHRGSALTAQAHDFSREVALARETRLMKLLDSRARQKATISVQEARERLGISR